MLIVNDCLYIDKGYTLEEFKKSPFYSGQDCSLFFWIDDVVSIKDLPGQFNIGFWFETDIIRQVHLHYSPNEENSISELEYQSIHRQFIKQLREMNPEAGGVDIVWNGTVPMSLIVIDYHYGTQNYGL